jgi:bifunctional DNA-binding transcriptional regulator/antitoxin component of YhaV-PrlF toxin-antitoxin module
MARVDRSGRLHERRLLRALGWAPGQQLALDVVHGLIVVQPARTRPHALDSRGALPLPAAVRRMCNISAGPPVVLAAAIPEQTLVIHPAALVAYLLAAHYFDLLGGRHER